ncbi:MAG: methionyl-tRNA formyltransferase [Rhodospirillaceae bacterium]
MSLSVVFMGTPDFSVPVLDALAEHHRVLAVYTPQPKPAGRGNKLLPCPVQARAEALGLPVRTPKGLKRAAVVEELAALQADVFVVAAYGVILSQKVLDLPRLGCINVHASLLPRWRGAAPIQRSIMAGDPESGVTIMRMEAGLDTGPMLLEEATPIGPEDTAASLHDRLAEIGARLILPALDGLAAGSLPDRIQPEDGVTYAHKIEKAEARVDWTRPASALDQHIRGLSPFPGAWCLHRGESGKEKRIKLLLSRVDQAEGQAAPPGTVLPSADGALRVACGSGVLSLIRLQREGKGPMETADFLRGLPLPPDTVLI